MNVVYTRNLFEALIKQTAQRGGSPSVENIAEAAAAHEKLVQEHAQMLKTLKQVAHVCAESSDESKEMKAIRVRVIADIAAIDPAHYGLTLPQEIPVGPAPAN